MGVDNQPGFERDEDSLTLDEIHTCKWDIDFGELKLSINNFLWVNLPPHTTIRQAENLAIVIFEAIEKLQDSES